MRNSQSLCINYLYLIYLKIIIAILSLVTYAGNMQQSLRGFVDDALYGPNANLLKCNDLAEFVFYSDRKPKHLVGTKLRRQIYRKLKESEIILQQHITEIVQNFVKELPLGRKKNIKMYGVFTCKCGWLLYDPTTLPCGHTLCKHCVKENMLCLDCGYTLTGTCNVSPFLVEVISSWFQTHYESTGFKVEAKDFFATGQFTDTLCSINKAIQLVTEDFTALNIRGKTHYNLDSYKLALQDAELSCKINDSCGKSYYIRGECFLAMKNFDQAIDSFQLSLEMDPEDSIMSNTVITRLSEVFAADVCENINDTRKRVAELSNLDYWDEDDISGTVKHDSTCKEEECKQHQKEIQTFSRKECDDNLQSLPNSSSVQYSKAQSYCASEPEKSEKTQLVYGVAANLINEEVFECKLCYDLLFRPVTLRCGHVFCKNCLIKTLDYNALCPVCRLELVDYLKNPMKPVTVLIEDILQIYLKEQFMRRTEEYETKMQSLSKVGIDDSVEHPIFVCTVVFPYVECPLHVFEPKYRQMIRECIEAGGLRFGMCCPQIEGYSDIGTILTITSYEVLDDGRFIIRTKATKRFVCGEKSLVDSLTYANVTYFQDDVEDMSSEEFSSNAKSIYDNLSTYVNNFPTAQREALFNSVGTLPPYQLDVTSYPDGFPWVWWGLSILPINFNAKLALLRSKCVTERLNKLQFFLRHL